MIPWAAARMSAFGNSRLTAERLAWVECSPREPVHIHALSGHAEAKFWLDPTVRVADSVGFSARALRELVDVVEQHRAMIEEAWHEHFG